jgi:hypothetical protein
VHPPPGQHEALGPVQVERQLLHPVRGARLQAHHLVPRPPRRDGALPDRHRGGLPAPSGPAVQRQPGRGDAARGRPAPGRLGRPVAICAATTASSPRARGARCVSRSGSSRRTRIAARTHSPPCSAP